LFFFNRCSVYFLCATPLVAVLVYAAYDLQQTRRAGIADGRGNAERRFEIRRTSEPFKVSQLVMA